MILLFEIPDQTIPWPERGSAEKQLCERAGWERRQIPTVSRGEPIIMEAMCRGELAVNRMLDDEGFAICLSGTGWRISSGGRVYARCADAMAVAEAMMVGCDNWSQGQERGYTASQRAVVLTLTDEAEKNGQILLNRVYPILGAAP